MVGAAVTWGLLVAWLIHDLEEWITIPAWSRLTAERLVRRFPRFPGRILSVLRTTRLEVTISIALVGVLVAAAAWVGASDAAARGSSRWCCSRSVFMPSCTQRSPCLPAAR